MHHWWTVVAVALVSAVCTAASSAWKHRAASDTPSAVDLTPRAVGRMMRALARHRLWAAAVVADGLGVAGQVTALHLGSLAVVQLVLTTSVVFAVLFRGRVRRHQLAWAGIAAAALATVLLLAAPSASVGAAEAKPAALVAVLAVLAVAGMVALARSAFARGRAQLLFAVAVGIVYAGTAALLKGVTDVASHHGWLAVTTTWELYAAIGCGAVGVLLGQIAFQAGPLAAGLPVTATVDPVVCVVIGVLVYDQGVHLGRWGLPGVIAAVVVLLVAVVRVARSGAVVPAT